MKKQIDSSELAEFVKERQLHAVRGLRQQWKLVPKIILLQLKPGDTDSFCRAIEEFASDIMVEIVKIVIDGDDIDKSITSANEDILVHGIILLGSDDEVEKIMPTKDIMCKNSSKLFQSPNLMAVMWLLASVNCKLDESSIVIIGKDNKLSNELLQEWSNTDIDAQLTSDTNSNLLVDADIIINTTDQLLENRTIIDRGMAIVIQTEVDKESSIEPVVIAALFENVITAARITLTW